MGMIAKTMTALPRPIILILKFSIKPLGKIYIPMVSLRADQLKVFNAVTKAPLDYQFITENNLNIIVLNSVGWKTEKTSVTFELKKGMSFNFYVDAERKYEDCCSFTVFNETKVENVPHEFETSKNLYSIFF